MKTSAMYLFAFAVFASTLSIAGVGRAENVTGRVTYVGTVEETTIGGGLSATFRIRLADSLCNGGSSGERWIHVIGGRVDGGFAHNAVNFRNAFNTAMTAFLSGKSLEVQKVTSCSTSAAQIVNLWQTPIGILQ